MGGETVVTLYRWHGLNTSTLYVGGEYSTEDGNLEWISNSELRIVYTDTFEQCRSASGVTTYCTSGVNPGSDLR